MLFEVRPPNSMKNVMVTFESSTRRETAAANAAVESVLKDEDLQPFHQMGCDPFYGNDAPGIHGWEIWVDGENIARVAALLPKIQTIYEKEYILRDWMED